MATVATATLYLAADAAREIGCTPAWVRLETARGRLRVAALSPRGVHLYALDDIAAYLADRETRRSRRA